MSIWAFKLTKSISMADNLSEGDVLGLNKLPKRIIWNSKTKDNEI